MNEWSIRVDEILKERTSIHFLFFSLLWLCVVDAIVLLLIVFLPRARVRRMFVPTKIFIILLCGHRISVKICYETFFPLLFILAIQGARKYREHTTVKGKNF